MMKTGGSIVLIASAAARTGLVNHEAIAAAKAGIVGLTLSAAATYASKNVRVNCVAPGLVRTPLTEALLSSEVTRKASESLHPLGRVAEPAEIASTIAWLLAPEQSFITGQIVGVDGGLATLRCRMKA
jgi:NAD(P)-dependent dehydrogenase (short-subunit alcohol dehydrogenase family)